MNDDHTLKQPGQSQQQAQCYRLSQKPCAGSTSLGTPADGDHVHDDALDVGDGDEDDVHDVALDVDDGDGGVRR